jgi:phosphate/sulfate permease
MIGRSYLAQKEHSMDFFEVFLYLSLGGAFLMAFSLGANDAANAMASAVGAKAITIRQAVVIAAVMNFVGAVFLGAHVTATISDLGFDYCQKKQENGETASVFLGCGRYAYPL